MGSGTRRGVGWALLSALFFGVTTPTLQWIGHGLGSFTTTALLCAGAALAALFATTLGSRDPQVRTKHAPRLLFVALLGMALGPALCVWGLSRANGTAACLLLNLEAVFTAFIGIALWREPIGWRFVVGIAAITCGAFALVGDVAANDAQEARGLLAVALATLCWSIDNAISRPLATLDPSEVVFVKSTVGALIAAAVALATEEVPSSRTALVGVFLCGFVGYGGAERFYLHAQRALGVARTSSLFAVSPFFGAAVALALGAPPGSCGSRRAG